MIDPILLTEVTLPPDHPRAGEWCPVFGFVIWHREGPVLFDTGVGREHEEIEAIFRPSHVAVEDALAGLGIGRRDVVMVVNSHLHFDHVGNNRYFAGIPMVVQARELDLARQPGYTIPEWVDFPGAKWQPVSGETEILPGIRVIPTPGHTPGHQSLVVQEGDTVRVVAGQAVYDPGELEAEESAESLVPDEADDTSSSARLIKSLAPKAVYFSHHPETWPTTN